MQNKIRNRIIEAIEINVSNPPFSDGGFSVYGVVIKRLRNIRHSYWFGTVADEVI